ncbi:Hypothetical protein BQ3484_300 [Cedratvirus A11]|uniref:Uncharacterized protein n=1 Tax=Cedratvirus A11 TaxID=1903266 RepID=A0A1M7XV11_9VIRU|nr:Hypothetical protein BQ3484_300 [Cedratvirus A11]SHO33368.1 Hypothetical protein BQ3484_300 [Cedratvirus A11]
MEDGVFPEDLKSLIEKLTFVSKIPKGQKVNLRSMNFSESSSLMTSVKRTLYCENRIEMVEFIDSCIKEANSMLLSSSNYALLISYLTKSIDGINNLMTTYRDDPYVVSKLEVCIKHIDLIVHSCKIKHDKRQAEKKNASI